MQIEVLIVYVVEDKEFTMIMGHGYTEKKIRDRYFCYFILDW